MTRLLRAVVVSAWFAGTATAGSAAGAEGPPEVVRGIVATVDGASLAIRPRAGATIRLLLPADTTIVVLSPASFEEVAFGTYVGAVARRLEAFPPHLRDSKSWLHRATELRIADESLRGILLGYASWDHPPGSTISHGWVDDIEERILSIKFGPTDDDETDVDIPADVPVQRMSVGDRRMVRPGMRVVASVRRAAGGARVAARVFIGRGGAVPAL